MGPIYIGLSLTCRLHGIIPVGPKGRIGMRGRPGLSGKGTHLVHSVLTPM